MSTRRKLEERECLFRSIGQLVNWDNLNDEKLFAEARPWIVRSVARNLGVGVPVGAQSIRETAQAIIDTAKWWP